MSLPSRAESGVYLVLFAVMITGLVALLALSIGLGIIAVNSTRSQQLANVVALAALEEYINQRGVLGSPGPLPLPEVIADLSAIKATTILQRNSLAGDIGGYGEVIRAGLSVTPTTSGVITPGSWFFEDPLDGSDPCATDPNAEPVSTLNLYPCFIPADLGIQPPAERPINAMKGRVFNQSDNPLSLPFASIFGYNDFSSSGEAISAIVQRCTAYLLDLSESSVLDTHFVPPRSWSPGDDADNSEFGRGYPFERNITDVNSPDPGWPPFCHGPLNPVFNPNHIVCPTEASFFAYKSSSLAGLATPMSSCSAVCDTLNPSSDVEGELLTWCNVACTPNTRARPSRVTSGIFKEDFWPIDYQLPGDPTRTVWMDLYNRPQPLSAFFLAFNAGMREVRRQSTAGDLALVMPFTADTRRRRPVAGMTKDLDLLIQLTNMDNTGRIASSSVAPILDPGVPRVYPNFAEVGWFPIRGTGNNDDRSTHITKALLEAVNVLQSECSASAQKAIVLATDGITTCAEGAVPECPSSREYSRYTDSIQHLLVSRPAGAPSVLELLQDNRISLTTLLAGRSVAPHFRRVQGGNFGEYLTPSEAFLSGTNPNDLFNQNGFSGAATEEEAYLQSGLPNVTFMNPNWVFGSVSLLSGGVFCPLLPRCEPSDCNCGGADCYEAPPGSLPPGTPNILKDCARHPLDDITARPLRSCSPFDESLGAQAARCVVRTLGGNPYILVR